MIAKPHYFRVMEKRIEQQRAKVKQAAYFDNRVRGGLTPAFFHIEGEEVQTLAQMQAHYNITLSIWRNRLRSMWLAAQSRQDHPLPIAYLCQFCEDVRDPKELRWVTFIRDADWLVTRDTQWSVGWICSGCLDYEQNRERYYRHVSVSNTLAEELQRRKL